MLKQYLSNIANAIRSKLGTTDKVNAQDFADKINEVYDKGSYNVWYRWCSNVWLGHTEIPYGITKLGLCCFYYNQMASVTIPESITTFENSVFSNCYKLKEVRMPSGLKSIGANCYNGCSDLEKMTFGTITGLSISTGVLGGCNKLTTIIIESGMLTQSCYFQHAPISVESMKHIIEHLTDYSGTDKEALYTIRFSDACWNALEADSTSPLGISWREYVQSLGWNL